MERIVPKAAFKGSLRDTDEEKTVSTEDIPAETARWGLQRQQQATVGVASDGVLASCRVTQKEVRGARRRVLRPVRPGFIREGEAFG